MNHDAKPLSGFDLAIWKARRKKYEDLNRPELLTKGNLMIIESEEITLLRLISSRQIQQHKETMRVLYRILRKANSMATDLDTLTAEVTNNTSVEQSAITLIQNIATELAAAGTDPVALAALVTKLQTNDAALAAAVTANTPAAPAAS